MPPRICFSGHRSEDRGSDNASSFVPESSLATDASKAIAPASISADSDGSLDVAKRKERTAKEEHMPLYQQTILPTLEETAVGLLEALSTGAFHSHMSGFAEQDQVSLACGSREVLDAAIAQRLGPAAVAAVCVRLSVRVHLNPPCRRPKHHPWS